MFRRERAGVWCLGLLVLGMALVAFPGQAVAAQRVVMGEDFTATWCVYCPYAGRALDMMLDNYPNTFTFLQIHQSDIYATAWGNTRRTYYGVTGFPTVWFDGKVKAVGAYQNDTQQYNWYNSIYQGRMAVPTDVSIKLYGKLLYGTTYQVMARVRVDPGGTAKDLRIHMVHALDHYPPYTGDDRYRNCLRDPAVNYEDVYVTPGQVVDILREFEFDAVSMAQQNDIRIIAWAQVPTDVGSAGQGEFYNAKMMSWPFRQLGDLDCSGVLDFGDINPFVLALSDPGAYASQYPGCDIMLADCNGDGVVNFDDINAFVALLTG